MANKRITMRKVRELLRLHYEQSISARQASKMLSIGKTAASEYLAGFKSSGLTYSCIKGMTDSELLNAINTRKESDNSRYKVLSNQFTYFEKELKRTGVTLQLLWEEYRQTTANAYGYSQFCYHFHQWSKDTQVSMHMPQKAGDKMYVDYTGQKLTVTNPHTGQEQEYEVFVAVLGASQLSYIEATPSQTKADWIAVNQSALRYFGGVPAAIVPDCLKSAVIKADKYEPEINATYNDFAEHYNTVILPARALHPKDKSLAENFVKNAYTSIYAPLRNEKFFSVEELNTALWEQLEKYNHKPFQKRDYSRAHLFDTIEKEQLRPLVSSLYELKSYCQLKVQYNHHLYLPEDKHYYSVPFRFTGKTVVVTYTGRIVEIFHNNSRIATHQRNRHAYGYSTKDEHRPADHKFVAEWTPQRFIGWASKIAPEAEEVVKQLLDSRKHPEQAYKSCMGLLNLAKKYDKDDFVKACQKALSLNFIRYKFIKNTLETKAFNLSNEEELQVIQLPTHENIRGKECYN